MSVSDGSVTMWMWNVLIVNSTALDIGGSIVVFSGRATLINSSTVNSTSHGVGGAFGTGVVTLEGGSLIANSTSRRNGGSFYLTSGLAVVSDASSVAHSYSAMSGGTAYLTGGMLVLTNHSTFCDSHAETDGGAVSMDSTTGSVA
eukprot:997793-Prymnesium_polylepis.1